MKILHVSDLHLGRHFNGLSLEEDHASILDQIAQAALDQTVGALVIAGDIFDRAAPPATAVRQFNSFLSRIASETDAAVIMIAGNHDSGDRIASMAVMTDTRRALIRGVVSADERPLLLRDAHGIVAFSALPFTYEYAARACFADEALQTPHQVLIAQLAAARQHLPEGARWVVVSHAFVTGAQGSDSERSLIPIGVGGLETVPPETFNGAHYVALGHLHRAQTAGAPHIRYCGSPLAFGFDEADATKSMTLVEIDAVGAAEATTIPFKPLRRVRVVKGLHAELLLNENSDDIVKAILTDETPVIDAMKRLRSVFPNACDMTYARDEQTKERKSFEARAVAMAKPIDVVNDFLKLVRDQLMTDDEARVLVSALSALEKAEAET